MKEFGADGLALVVDGTHVRLFLKGSRCWGDRITVVTQDDRGVHQSSGQGASPDKPADLHRIDAEKRGDLGCRLSAGSNKYHLNPNREPVLDSPHLKYPFHQPPVALDGHWQYCSSDATTKKLLNSLAPREKSNHH